MAGLADGLFQAFINYLYSSGEISIPSDFHEKCAKVKYMLNNDITGLVTSLTDYAVNSATNTKYRIECSNSESLGKILNDWLSEINLHVQGISTGLKELSREYYREMWQGSSFCGLKIGGWKKVSYRGIEIELPTVMWFVNGSSIYVNRPDKDNFRLGTDKFFLDEKRKISLKNDAKTNFIIQKPFDRWFEEYPVPYLVRRGVLKNWLAIEVLQNKSNQILSKFVPYLFIATKGTENAFISKDLKYDDSDMKKLVEYLEEQFGRYDYSNSKVPIHGVPFDQKYEHLIPDLRNILTTELYNQGYRAILAGLGFIDVVQGITSTRRESVLNPKPFISEINAGVSKFESLLFEVIELIIKRNKKHKKLFGLSNSITISHSPLAINTEAILDLIRSSYDRGALSIRSYLETLGFDLETEKERRLKEYNDNLESLFYPHIIQNLEQYPDDKTLPSKPRNENLEDQNKKKNTPEANNFKNAEANLEIAPYTLKTVPNFVKKMLKECQQVFVSTFNKVFEQTGGDEGRSFAIAFSAAKRCMKKKGYVYKKETKTWEKESKKGD